MSDDKDCVFYDIGNRFFGVPIDNEKMERIDCRDMCCEMQNVLVARADAIDIIKKMDLKKMGELWCSVDAVKGRNVKDYLGRHILERKYDGLTGWLFFLDNQPYANWSHACDYYFVYGNNKCYHCSSQYGLYVSINMEKL